MKKNPVRSSALLALAALGLGALSPGVHAQVDQVKVWAAACANCHGTDGRAQPGMVALAGRSASDLTRAMLEFKAGTRPATIMHQLSKGYSDEQIQQIAAYLAAQKP